MPEKTSNALSRTGQQKCYHRHFRPPFSIKWLIRNRNWILMYLDVTRHIRKQKQPEKTIWNEIFLCFLLAICNLPSRTWQKCPVRDKKSQKPSGINMFFFYIVFDISRMLENKYYQLNRHRGRINLKTMVCVQNNANHPLMPLLSFSQEKNWS